MKLDIVRAALDANPRSEEQDTGGGLVPEVWVDSQQTLPAHNLAFLEPEYVAAACATVSLPPETTTAAVAAARHIAADPMATALAWYAHHLLFHTARSWHELHTPWPPLTALLGEDAALFNLLVVLSNLPQLEELYAQHAIPLDVARDTVADVALHVRLYQQEHGAWGLDPSIVRWLRYHMRGELYQLGRLQFAPNPFDLAVRAFRHMGTGAVIALSEDGIRYRADGQRDGAGGVYDPANAWTARLSIGADEVVGHPILPTGAALPRQVRLPGAVWRQVLAPGDRVLDIHIPRGTPLDFAQCGASFHAAHAFFARHFPAQPFTAFVCESWLLDEQLEHLLPPSANLVRFQQEMYLVPIPTDGTEALRWVFGDRPDALQNAPRRTRLERAIVGHLQAGNHMRAGGCFLFPEDLRWGEQVYRRQASFWLGQLESW